MKVYFILIFFLLAFVSGGNAQKEATPRILPKYTIAVQPFYLVNGGLRFDFEKRMKKPEHWLQFNVSGYYLYNKDLYGNQYYFWETPNSDSHNFTGLKGIGAGSSYKIFAKGHESLYFSGGLSYTYYNVNYKDKGYVPFVEDGLTYYEFLPFRETQHFNKLSSAICMGLQTPLKHKLFFDVYVGVGYNYSFYDESKAAFNSGIWGFGYRGVVFTGGFRLGLPFGKYYSKE